MVGAGVGRGGQALRVTDTILYGITFSSLCSLASICVHPHSYRRGRQIDITGLFTYCYEKYLGEWQSMHFENGLAIEMLDILSL